MHAAPKSVEQRDTGLSFLGRMPWSAHLSLFYETPADLVDTIVPYFEAGLRGGELCLWLPSEPTMEKQALDQLRQRVPDFDQHLARGAVEFIRGEQWYRAGGVFDMADVMQRWQKLLHRVREEGYSGLRVSGDTSWLGADEWRAFVKYEEALHDFVQSRPVMILCTYPLGHRTAIDVLDSVRTHHIAIAKRKGRWETVETPSLKKTKEQIQRVNDELEERVAQRTEQLARSETYLKEAQRLSHTGTFAYDAATKEYTYVSPELRRMFGFDEGDTVSRADLWARFHPSDLPKAQKVYEALLDGRDAELEFRIVLPDGRVRHILTVCHPVVDAAGRLIEVIGTDVDITDRKRASAKLARAMRSARERALEARFAAALEERARLAREIHDSLLQGVTGIALQLRATLPRLKSAPVAVRDSIRGVVELAETTIGDARRAVWDMRAPSLVQKGLPTALANAVRRMAGDIELDFAIDGKPRALAPEVEDTIFRVGQEAVLNAVKHAAARGIKVKLSYKPRSATLIVADNGRGFGVDQAFGAYAGRWGLLGMRERADRIGASLSIRSTPRSGTTVTLRVPVAGSRSRR